MAKREKVLLLIDPKKIGNTIQKLREAKHWTRRELAKRIGDSCEKSIYDWERNNILPSQDYLMRLAKVLDVTVDDILAGEKTITQEELLDKYPILDERKYYSTDEAKVEDPYTRHQTLLIAINKRLRELIIRYGKTFLTRNEEKELHFLFTRMCRFEAQDNTKHEPSMSAYSLFISKLTSLKADGLTGEEFYWEAQKYFTINSNFKLNPHLWECTSNDQGFEHKKFLLLENWEKDMLLAKFQNFDILDFNPESNVYSLRRYESIHGEEFNKEKAIKDILKYLIDNGAVINRWFLSGYKVEQRVVNIIDELERLYNLCLAPIVIYYSDDKKANKYIRAAVENNTWNRFLNEYHKFSIQLGKEDVSPQELYRLLMEGSEEEMVEIFYEQAPKNKDKPTKYNEKKAYISPFLSAWNKTKAEFLEREQKIEAGKKKIEFLENLLKKGETATTETVNVEIGPKLQSQLLDYIICWKAPLQYKEFLVYRNKSSTSELRAKIDNLSLEEIKEKYFKKEFFNYGQ